MTNSRQPLNLQTIQAENWVDRYVQNRLNASETEVFEQFMLDSPEVQDDVLAAMTLKQGLPSALQGIEKSGTGASWLSRLLNGGVRPAASLAGGALAVTFAVLFILANSEVNLLESQLAGTAGPQGDISTAYLPQVRSAGTTAFEPVAVMSAKTSGWTLLQLELAYTEQAEFTVTVQPVTVQPLGQASAIFTLNNVKASKDDTLSIAVPAEQLPAGNYVAKVSDGGKAIAEFPFSVE